MVFAAEKAFSGRTAGVEGEETGVETAGAMHPIGAEVGYIGTRVVWIDGEFGCNDDSGRKTGASGGIDVWDGPADEGEWGEAAGEAVEEVAAGDEEEAAAGEDDAAIAHLDGLLSGGVG
ncbi:MAG: hypothetical protein ABI587_06945 [Gemmatimonadales bacterium]